MRSSHFICMDGGVASHVDSHYPQSSRTRHVGSLHLETTMKGGLHNGPHTPHIFHVQRDVLDRGDDLVLVGNAGRALNQEKLHLPGSRDLAHRLPEYNEDTHDVASSGFVTELSMHNEENDGPFPSRCLTLTKERLLIRQGTGSFIDREQLVIESDYEPEEATFDQLKAWLNRDRKIIYTPAPEEQVRASPTLSPHNYDSPIDPFFDFDSDSDASDATESAHIAEQPGSKTLPTPNQLFVPEPTTSHAAVFLRDGSSTSKFSLKSTSNNIPCFEHDRRPATISSDALPDSFSFPEAQRNPLYPNSFEPPGGSRRSVVFRAVEEMFFECLPRRRKPRWMALQHSMKIYPFTIHYAIQALEFLATVTLPLPYITRTFNGIDHESFLRRTSEWTTWTVLEAVARHDQIKSSLIEVLSHVEMLVAYASEIPLARVWSQLLRECLLYDNDDMKQVVDAILVLGEKAIEHTMRLTAKERNTLMNVLQTLIDLQVTNHRFCEKFLQKLVRQSGELPGYLIIHDVERLGTNPIGGGGFSDVWKGSLRNSLVAMKVLRLFNLTTKERNRIKMDYCTESMLWRQLKHQNVLPFYGVAVDSFAPQLAMISPWLENGCVTSYLKENTSVDRRHMITGVASGLRYLHTLKPLVVHGDLRGANVLIDDQGHPRLADFGLAQFFDSQASCAGPSFRGGGTLRWQAPELLASSNFNGISNSCQVTTCSDVYAFAILCWEIFTLDVPYSGLRDGDVVLRVIRNKERPPRPPDHAGKLGLSDRLWKLIVNCWDHYPQSRPSMDIVVQKLMAGTTVSNERTSQPSGLDFQKIDVFHIPDTTVILPSIDSVLSSRRSTLSRASSTTLTPTTMGSPWSSDAE